MDGSSLAPALAPDGCESFLVPPCIPQGYTFPRWIKETPLPCDSDPGQTITSNTPSLKSTFLVSQCVVGNGKRTGKGVGASQLCCWGQCLKPGAESHFLPHRGSVTGSYQSLMVASCQETFLCFRLSSLSPGGMSLPQEVSQGDSRTDQGVQSYPALKFLQGRAVALAADLCHHPTC